MTGRSTDGAHSTAACSPEPMDGTTPGVIWKIASSISSSMNSAGSATTSLVAIIPDPGVNREPLGAVATPAAAFAAAEAVAGCHDRVPVPPTVAGTPLPENGACGGDTDE